MGFLRRAKNRFIRLLSSEDSVPRGLFELSEYFRNNGPINFEHHVKNGEIISVSTNFRCGSIITSASSEKELDKNIRDAILTTFDVPSSYAKEAGVTRVSKESKKYALA
jgi:hypothetical protein